MARKTETKAGTLYLVHVLTHSTRSRLDRELAPLGLSSFHYTVLSVVARNDGLSSARLSRRFHVTPQAMGEIIVMLEKKRLIVREEDPNHRRILHLKLTTEAQAILADADKLVGAFEKQIFGAQADADIAVFRRVLADVLAGLRDPRA